jgi:hypothetical protein
MRRKIFASLRGVRAQVREHDESEEETHEEREKADYQVCIGRLF